MTAAQRKYKMKQKRLGSWRLHRGNRTKQSTNQRKKYPEKIKAWRKLNHAIKLGIVIRPNKCGVCKKTDGLIMAHHPDYKKPIDVVWVCSGCHIKIHKSRKGVIL